MIVIVHLNNQVAKIANPQKLVFHLEGKNGFFGIKYCTF